MPPAQETTQPAEGVALPPETPAPPEPVQLRLFPAASPLVAHLGVGFFRGLPTQPGVYLMRDEAGRLLYVGKAKNLRQRLNSYRHATRASRKTVRLIHAVRRIDLELCVSDESARLRENALLREHRPRFNRVGTWPQAYGFIELEIGPREFRLARTVQKTTRAAQDDIDSCLPGVMAPADWRGVVRVFGAFKAGLTFAFPSLLRLLWAALHQPPLVGEFPRRLLLEAPPRTFDFQCDDAEDWGGMLASFLEGTSASLLDHVSSRLPQTTTLFHEQLRLADMERANDFFLRGPKRNHDWRRHLGRTDALIRPEEVDDLFILAPPSAPESAVACEPPATAM